MPPKTARALTKKRTIGETDGASSTTNPPAKKVATSKRASRSKKVELEILPPPASPNGNRRRVPLGPNGEYFIPKIMPRECLKAIEKMHLPPGWVSTIDATPDHGLSLKDRKWWELNSPWLEANKKNLGLSAKHWKMRDEAYAKDQPREEDEGSSPDDFICIFPPGGEQKDPDEYDDDDGDDDDEEEENEDSNAEKKNKDKEASADEAAMYKNVGKLASLHPGHTWVSSMCGDERMEWWLMEILKRDQDGFCMHIYNDFTYYGTIEVLENLFVNFEKVHKRKSHTPLELWQELEGLALILNSSFVEMELCDDSDRCGQILELIGFMTLTVIASLQKQGLFAQDSQIPNIALMLALLVKYAWTTNAHGGVWDDEITWIFSVLKHAEDANITLSGPAKFAEILEEMKDTALEQTTASRKKWTKSTFAKKFASYGSRGGNEFDIAKMPAAQRKEYSFR
ncbi:hypothetical protein ACHAQJ_003007 [Trichoderma viride]